MKCQHGIDLGPLDEVKSSYCIECFPRVVKQKDGKWINTIEIQYLTDEEKQRILGEPNEMERAS